MLSCSFPALQITTHTKTEHNCDEQCNVFICMAAASLELSQCCAQLQAEGTLG